MSITVLICTHNRAELLERVLQSLHAAKHPSTDVEILVVANACTDGTHVLLDRYARSPSRFPLRWIAEPTPGKSHALNRAIPEIRTELTAFVDDDHRIDPNYLVAIEEAAKRWPDAGIYCGRILPDWDGTEPSWVHDEGPYRIYPLPVPRYDQGPEPREVSARHGPVPGGGNLIIRRHVFRVARTFSTELGPLGHDLGGGEDTEYVLRALAHGIRCQYVPSIVQYHYVDRERLKPLYLVRKAYQRTRSSSRIHGNGRIPLYMWRKLIEYAVHSLLSLSWPKNRFYLVRTAAALGEIHGRWESGRRARDLKRPLDSGVFGLTGLISLGVGCGALAVMGGLPSSPQLLLPPVIVALIGALGLSLKSIIDFSQTGPRIRDEIITHYQRYTALALARLSIWAFLILLFASTAGAIHYYAFTIAIGQNWHPVGALIAALVGVVITVLFQFAHKLRSNPGLIVASINYRASRLYPLWRLATPKRLKLLAIIAISVTAILWLAATIRLIEDERFGDMAPLWAAALFYTGFIVWASHLPKPRLPPKPSGTQQSLPNIVMLGSDTLRADRLGILGYSRALTPAIDALSKRSALFANCYVPCARTAPSLISMLTGCWPQTHGIRDNFVADDDTRLSVASLPQLLKPLGYRSAAISDWCGADMGKFSLGFDYVDLPEDQWNLKYLIRQGPKDLRLLVSLFTHNRLGRYFLPELYYLGGAPLTDQIGPRARELASRLIEAGSPFMLNVFYSTTHPPFASTWPWYTRFADPNYVGESKFAMARLTDPFEIIRRQGAPRDEFDLDHIIDLYDGCVAQFDDEVAKMLRHLEACGVSDNTIVVIYSDHGMEFFEHETWGQGNSAVAEASPRIPLLIHDPRHVAKTGIIRCVARSIDLAPTLLEIVGGNVPHNMDGVSLAKCLAGTERFPELDAFNETGIWIADVPGLPPTHLRYPNLFELLEVPDRDSGTLAIKPEYREITLRAKDRMIRSGPWKLVYQPLTEGYLLKLFNVENDPHCNRDVATEEPDVTAQLWARLAAWMEADPASGPLPGRNGSKDCASTPRLHQA